MLDNPFYIYRHIRPDTNEVFYIGKGSNLSRESYQRVFSKERSKWWKRIVALNEGKYIKEIIFECNSENECFQKEKEFISLYGRKDLGKGTLVNMTNGGDGVTGIIITERQKKETSERTSKKVIDIYTKSVYKNGLEASSKLNINHTQICGYLTGKLTNTTSLVFYSVFLEKGEQYCIDNLINQKWTNKASGKEVLDTISGAEYCNAKEAALAIGINPRYLRSMLCGIYPNKTSLKYKYDQRKWGRKRKEVIDVVSGITYEGLAEAAKSINKHTTYLSSMLNGRYNNNTNLRFKDGV